MRNAARSLGRLVLGLLLFIATCFAAEKPRIQVNDYIIHVVVTPQTHQLKAQARVKFTALEDINIATFELHNALAPDARDRHQRAIAAGRARQLRFHRPHFASQYAQQGLVRHVDIRI